MHRKSVFITSLIALTAILPLQAVPSQFKPLTTTKISETFISPHIKISFDEQARSSPVIRVIVSKEKGLQMGNLHNLQPIHELACANQIIFTLENPSSFPEIEQFLSSCKLACKQEPFSGPGYWTTEKKLGAFTTPCVIQNPVSIEVIASGNISKEALEKTAREQFQDLDFSSGTRQKVFIFQNPFSQTSSLTIDFTNKKFSLKTVQDLKKFWKNGVLQKFIQKKAENLLVTLNGSAYPKHVDSFLPDYYVGVTASCKEDNILEILGSLLLETEEIKKQGLTPKEFSEIQEFFQKHLKNRETITAFYENGLGLSFNEFLQDSEQILSELTSNDIQKHAQEILNEENIEISLTCPFQQAIQKEEVFLTIEQIKSISTLSTLSSYSKSKGNKTKTSIPIPIEGNPTDLFLKLPIKESEKKMIGSILETMADNNVFQLALKEHEMTQRGDRINHVHPLRFLGIAFSDPKLKNCMCEIKKNYFKWNGFISGFSKRIEEEYDRNNLLRYIPGFANYLNIDADQIKRYISNQDWDGLVRFLMN